MSGYEIHKQEQEEARQAEAFKIFKERMAKIDRDHDIWVKRCERADMIFIWSLVTVVALVGLSFSVAIIHQIFK